MAWFGGTYEGAEDVGIWVSRRAGHGWDYPHLAAKASHPTCRRREC
jgi:predicted neuraminidase